MPARGAEATEGGVQLAKKAVDVVRELIALGELLPGEKINQMEIAERAGVSRSPLREALRTLEADGIVTYETNRGYVVARFRMSELAEIYRLRVLVEHEMLEHITKPGPDVIKRLQKHVDEMEKAVQSKDFAGMTRAYREFHVEVFRLSNLKVFLDEVQRLWTMTDSYNAMHRMPEDIAKRMLRDHRGILSALSSGNLERARKIATDLPQINEHVVVGLPAWH
jgi:DNA-binding GntR family transcriptional regulator